MDPVTRGIVIVLAIMAGIGGLMIGLLALPGLRYESSFERIEIGTTRNAVFTQLGDPRGESTNCYVAQFIEYEKPSRWTAAFVADKCAYWIGPGIMGKYFVVGFGVDDKVVGVAYGDS